MSEMTREQDLAEMLQEAERLHSLLVTSLPKQIDAKSLAVRSKLPFKALAVREALFHRTEELTESTLILLKANNVIAAAFLARGIMENAALQYKLSRTIKNRTTISTADLDTMLMRMMLGFRDDEDFPKAYQIMNLIDDLNDLVGGFKYIHSVLSEFVHPNSSGVARVYLLPGADKYEFNFAKNQERLLVVKETCLTALKTCLDLYLHQYNQMADMLNEWVTALRAEGDLSEPA